MAAGPIKYLQLRSDDIHETGKTLGKGAYGKVVEVLYLGTPCAAKRMHSILEEAGSHLCEGFRRECETWSQLRHPNVVQLLGLLYKPSASSKLPMIVMEKMDCSLRQFVETNKRETIPFYVKVDVLHQVVQGLAYLHGQRPPVIHRDLSPNNILINLGSMAAKLSDFGVAKFQIHHASRSTTLPGTPAFMPPETLPGAPPSVKGYSDRIDVFSYAGVVICTVTHMWPEPMPSRTRKEGKLVALDEIERRQTYLDHFTAEEKETFLGLVQHCLEYEPVDRPTSQELLETLQTVKDTHPGQSYVHLLQRLETVTESSRDAAKQLQRKTEDMKTLQQESDERTARLSSERDAALIKLKEMEENVFILQQTVESLQSQIEEQEMMHSRIKEEKRLEHTWKEPLKQYHTETEASLTEYQDLKVEQSTGPVNLQLAGSLSDSQSAKFRGKSSLSTSDVNDEKGSALPNENEHDMSSTYGWESKVVNKPTVAAEDTLLPFPVRYHVPPLVDDTGSIQADSSEVSYAVRHDLPTTQSQSQKFPQQPQHPSTQLQPTTKRATKALLIVDPDTNKPLDLVGVSSSSKSKSPEPASVTSPTQDTKREEFMAKIIRKFTTSEDYSQTEPSEHAASSTQCAMPHTTESTLLADSTSSKDPSRVSAALQSEVIPSLHDQQQHRTRSVAQMVSAQTTDIYEMAGVDLVPQPNLPPINQAMVPSAEAQNREQVAMLLPQQTTSTAKMQVSSGARHDLPTAQPPSQKFPQQPSTQPQPKAPSATKRATKALLIVDPDTNEPVDCQQVLPM